MKFEVLFGSHTEGTILYKQGDIVESNENLDKLFVNKFKRVPASTKSMSQSDLIRKNAHKNPGVTSETPTKAEDQSEGAAHQEENKAATMATKERESDIPQEEEEESDWSDVSNKFSKANEEFIVMQKEKEFNIYAKDDTESPLNDKPLAKKDVNKFIDSLKE